MDERTRILKLVENGTITAEEGISLLEALAKEKAPQSEQTSAKVQPVLKKEQTEEVVEPVEEIDVDPDFSKGSESEKGTTGFEDLFGKAFNNKKFEQVVNDIREDVSEFSERMVTFMNSTLSRVKSGEMPFGDKIEFENTFAYPVVDVKAFEIDIPNGKLDIIQSDDDQVLVKVFAKAPLVKSTEEEVKEQFFEDFIELKDGTLSIATASKLTHVTLSLHVPAKKFDVVIAKLLSGGVTLEGINAKLLKAKTYNGVISYKNGQFEHADFQTANGAVEVRAVTGEDLEIETVNGRIDVDGAIKEISAESVNGAVILTTTSVNAHKVKAETLAGVVELYVPKKMALDGIAASNFGKVDLRLADIVIREDDEQFLRKTTHFTKQLEDGALLKIHAESRTGSVIIGYSGSSEEEK